MRVAPIGIACAGQPAKAAARACEDATLPHPHPICQAASAAFAAAIAAGVGGANPRAMWSAAYAHSGEDAAGAEISLCLSEARDALLLSFTAKQGCVLISFDNAFHRPWLGLEFGQALVKTVIAGCDTDTNAAICGALLGAAQGRETILLRWRQHVLGCRAVVLRGVQHPRPVMLWAEDAMELAEGLITAT